MSSDVWRDPNHNPWDLQQFVRTLGEEKGLRVYAMREVLGEFLDAVKSHRTWELLPDPNVELDRAYVEEAVRIIDEEWEKEWLSRDTAHVYETETGTHVTRHTFSGGPEFSKYLAYPQKLALVQRLRKIKYGE